MDLISGFMFTYLGLEFLVGLDFLAIHRKDDIALLQTGLEGGTVRFWRSHHYATFVGGRDWRERINVSMPAQANSEAT